MVKTLQHILTLTEIREQAWSEQDCCACGHHTPNLDFV